MGLEHKINLISNDGLESEVRPTFFNRIKNSLVGRIAAYGLATFLTFGTGYVLSGCSDYSDYFDKREVRNVMNRFEKSINEGDFLGHMSTVNPTDSDYKAYEMTMKIFVDHCIMKVDWEIKSISIQNKKAMVKVEESQDLSCGFGYNESLGFEVVTYFLYKSENGWKVSIPDGFPFINY